jgi:hypothetical protein
LNLSIEGTWSNSNAIFRLDFAVPIGVLLRPVLRAGGDGCFGVVDAFEVTFDGVRLGLRFFGESRNSFSSLGGDLVFLRLGVILCHVDVLRDCGVFDLLDLALGGWKVYALEESRLRSVVEVEVDIVATIF